jgi:ABC-type multidrug transport system fused ATPase/permease subunit
MRRQNDSPSITGLALFACTFTYMYIWVHTGEISTKRLREHYLRAILHQDVAFFDNVGAGEVASCIQTDTREFAAICILKICVSY